MNKILIMMYVFVILFHHIFILCYMNKIRIKIYISYTVYNSNGVTAIAIRIYINVIRHHVIR